MNDTQQIKRFFNKASQTYDQCSQLQQRTGDKLIHLLQEVRPHTTRIIDLGCGTGLTTKKLASAFTHHHLTALDIAPALLNKTQMHLLPFHFLAHEGDFNDIAHMKKNFSLIFSNMALQWSTDLTETLRVAGTQLEQDGLLAFSIPLSGTLIELKHHYQINHFFSPESILEKLMQANLHLVQHHTETIKLPFDNLFTALKSIKQVGANHTSKRLRKGLGGKSFLYARVLQQLTYVIGFFIAKKKFT